MDDEMCAQVVVMMKNGAEEKYGILIGITAAMSSMCKWSFGDIEYSNNTEKLIGCFGEPSAYISLSSAAGGISYVTENGSMAVFISELNGFMCLTLDTDSAIKICFLPNMFRMTILTEYRKFRS